MQENTITFIQYIGILIAIIAYLPLRLLFRNYNKTQIVDYALFGGVFVFESMILLSEAVLETTSNQLLRLIYFISSDTIFLVLLIHAMRFKWKNVPLSAWIVGISWYSMLLFGGFILDYSNEYKLLGILFSLYVLIILLFIYSTVKPIYLSPRARMSKYLWILGWLTLIIHKLFVILSIQAFDSSFSYSDEARVFLLLWILITLYITLFFPEGLLLSESQVIRVLPIYDAVEEDKNQKEEPHEISELQNYIKEISKRMREFNTDGSS